MTYADTLEAPKVIELKGDGEANVNFVDPGKIFTFRRGPFNLSRWTRVNITNFTLPGTPIFAVAQVGFPNNTSLTVSDNFSCITAVLTRSRYEVNIWRVDGGGDPSIDYFLDFMIVTR